MMGPWATLGIDPTGDIREIRKAYARLLKAMDPETDPEGFAALREARDWAMYLAEQQAEEEEADDAEDADEAEDVEDGDDAEGAGEAAADPAGAAAPEPVAAAAPDLLPIERAPDLRGQADFEALHALHAMVHDRSRSVSQEEMTALVERILADPAMQNLAHAQQVERFFAETISEGTPRSDPMIDRAIAYFRWDSDDSALHRPPVIDWILKRARDLSFEAELRTENRRMYRYLRRLRQAPPSGVRGWIDGWLSGPRVEYMLAYARNYHPTILAGLNEDSHAWWADRIKRQRAAPFPIGILYRERCRRILDTVIDQAGLSAPARLMALMLMSVFGPILLGMIFHVSSPPDPNRVQPPARPAFEVVAPAPELVVLDQDLEQLLSLFTNGALSLPELPRVNPDLYARLKREWDSARARRGSDPHPAFQALVKKTDIILSHLLARVLRDGDGKLVLDFATYYEQRLRWAERAAPETCVAVLEGRDRGPDRRDLSKDSYALLARAIRTGTPPADDVKNTGTYTVPSTLMDEAMTRARLNRAAFVRALHREGPPLAICNARIALIDAALVRRDKTSLTLLRAMFGG
ncbi:hypothetical protein [Sphingomonas morindae]|uniref:J domain-containing protein n=1 Tax=Sphingomonas morindae TaxID=1541170 RepID=A0ABY4X9X4_9SPHN|nr:hypothetical protein [Sphingomonas morindae]USI73757.1 hypothetical protein LHA26_04615 [Sphingomonas morindae]